MNDLSTFSFTFIYFLFILFIHISSTFLEYFYLRIFLPVTFTQVQKSVLVPVITGRLQEFCIMSLSLDYGAHGVLQVFLLF